MSDKKKQSKSMFRFSDASSEDEESGNYFNSDGEVNLLGFDSPESDSDADKCIGEICLAVPIEDNTEDDGKEDIVYTSKDGTTLWHSNPILSSTPKLTPKIEPGLKPYARNAKNELDCWKLFFSDEILEEILQHTNVEINSRTFPDSSSRRPYLNNETSMEELLAMLGLMYIAGLNNSKRYNLRNFWRSDGTGIDIFRMTMSWQRFNFIQGCMRFDDASTREERNAIDNIASVRGIFEKFVQNCQKAYTPSEFLTLDDKFLPFHGECFFQQYGPHLSASYGIRMLTLVDAKVYYTINLEIHAGDQPEGPYYVSYEPFELVDRLLKPVSKTNRNVTLSNKLMCVPTAKHLMYEHGLTSTGALRRDNREIPPDFLTMEGRGVHSSRFGFQKDLTLVSYIPNKSKNVVLLSSLHHDQSLDPKSGKNLKPEILQFYNSTRTAVECVNKLSKMYDVRTHCKNWQMLIFYNMMNIAVVNSYIVYQENKLINPKVKRAEFIRKLSLSLVAEFLKIRKSQNNLPRELRKRIFEQTGESPNEDTSAGDPKAYKRCRECPSAKDRKTKYRCIECKNPICLEHVVTMCQNCSLRIPKARPTSPAQTINSDLN